MSKEQVKDLLKFLKPFPKEKKEIALWLRDFVWDLYPESNEIIYDNYNALAFGWSITDKVGDLFCTIAVGRSSYNIHFGFYWGTKISDPKQILLGQGNQYRYILVENQKDFPAPYMKKLVKQAYAYSLGKLKVDKRQVPQGETITKSISVKKRPAAFKKKKSK